MNIHNNLSRRNALKFISLSMVTASLLHAKEKKIKITRDAKIVIVGGGSSAIIMLSNLLKSMQSPNITIIAPNEKHIYQPGQLYVASGIYESEELIKENVDYIPKNVEWIKEKVIKFLPDENKLLTDGSKEISYDYLIIATGLEYHYEWIKGLTKEDIGTKNIASVYLNNTDKGTVEGGDITWKWLNELKEASKIKKQKVIFSKPNTMLKCGATAQKVMYMSADYLKKHDLEADYIYSTSSSRLFGAKSVSEALQKAQKEYKTITNLYKHNLIEIDIENKIATYKHKYQIKKGWDPDFREWESIENKEDIIKVNYDFIHIVPPMSAPDIVLNSSLATPDGMFKGWLDVEDETLQHKKYKNIFGIGDVCGTPLGKTIPSASYQAKVVLKNLQALMAKKELQAKFNGHSVCPIKVGFGKVVMAEFNYSGLTPTFSYLDASKPSYLWWLYDVHLAKPFYWHLVLPARV